LCQEDTVSPREWCFAWGQLIQEGNIVDCVKRTPHHQESDVLPEVSEAKTVTIVVSRGHCITKRVMFCLRSMKPRGQPLLCQEDTVSPRKRCLPEVSEAKRATVVSRGHCITKRVMFCLRSVKPRGQLLLCQEGTVSPWGDVLPEVTLIQSKRVIVVSRGHCITKKGFCYVQHWRHGGNRCCVKRTLYHQKGDVCQRPQWCQEGNSCVKRTLYHQESEVLPEVSEAKRETVVVSRGHCITKRVMFCLRSQWCQEGNRFCVKTTPHHEVMVLARIPFFVKDC